MDRCSEVMKAMLEMQEDRITHNQRFVDMVIETKIEAIQSAFNKFAESAMMDEAEQHGPKGVLQ
jgi:hypothetical protein